MGFPKTTSSFPLAPFSSEHGERLFCALICRCNVGHHHHSAYCIHLCSGALTWAIISIGSLLRSRETLLPLHFNYMKRQATGLSLVHSFAHAGTLTPPLTLLDELPVIQDSFSVSRMLHMSRKAASLPYCMESCCG